MKEITNFLLSIEPRTYAVLLFLPLNIFAVFTTFLAMKDYDTENLIRCIFGLIGSLTCLSIAVGLVNYFKIEKCVLKGEQVFLLIDGKATINVSTLLLVPIITTILIIQIVFFKK